MDVGCNPSAIHMGETFITNSGHCCKEECLLVIGMGEIKKELKLYCSCKTSVLSYKLSVANAWVPVLAHGKMKVGGVDKEILPWEWFDIRSGEWRLAKEDWWLGPNPESGTVEARKVLIFLLHLIFYV